LKQQKTRPRPCVSKKVWWSVQRKLRYDYRVVGDFEIAVAWLFK
jgi:hypothetical protein